LVEGIAASSERRQALRESMCNWREVSVCPSWSFTTAGWKDTRTHTLTRTRLPRSP
jgi:hypothetical protein